MMSNEKDNLEQELKVLHSLIGDKDALPAVPEGYFEQLEEDILHQTVFAQVANQHPRIIRMRWWKTITAVAAVTAAVFIGFKWLGNKQDDQLEIQLANMSGAEIDAFMDGQIASLSYDDLHDYIKTNINDISMELLFTTEFISEETALDKVTEDVHNQVMKANQINAIGNDTMLLDEELLKQIDEQVLQDYLNDATLFDDFAL